jgi:hypothetical protein
LGDAKGVIFEEIGVSYFEDVAMHAVVFREGLFGLWIGSRGVF